jgi:hypothetical protein
MVIRFQHALLLLAVLGGTATARANDFPTHARVEFVLECMRSSKAPQEEAMYKCSCAIDDIANKVSYSEWVDRATVANGITIAGERGGVMRDMKDGRKIAASYRELQAAAKKHCFLQ